MEYQESAATVLTLTVECDDIKVTVTLEIDIPLQPWIKNELQQSLLACLAEEWRELMTSEDDAGYSTFESTKILESPRRVKVKFAGTTGTEEQSVGLETVATRAFTVLERKLEERSAELTTALISPPATLVWRGHRLNPPQD